MNLADAFMKMLILWVQATGRPVVEISLARTHYLALAAELRFDDPGAPLRAFWKPAAAASFFGEVSPADGPNWGEVRVPSSFVFNGPGGPVTVHEAAE